MAENTGDRSSFFPAIESKHGLPVAHWLELLEASGETSYPAQVALLREGHGFSRAHANAVVMWFRGSTSAQRFGDPAQFFDSLAPVPRATITKIFDVIQAQRPNLELVMAWNHPMLRAGRHYVIGVSVAAQHLTINPFSLAALERASDLLSGYLVNKHTFRVPSGWDVDGELLDVLVQARMEEISEA
jgi:uncharacterized protein